MKVRLVLVFFIMFFVSCICVAKDNAVTEDEGLHDVESKKVLSAKNSIIAKIEIEGLHNVKSRKVLSVVELKKGKFYSVDAAREDVGAITALGYFDDVEVRYDESKRALIFAVTEKPYINHIIFKGNCEFSQSKLKSTSLLKEKNYYDLLKLEETKKKIFDLYKDRGYADCQIEVYPTIDSDTNKMTITFLITENNKIVIGGINIEGIISFKKKKVFNLIRKTRAKKAYKEEFFKEDLYAIQEFYQNNGFMDYQLVSSTNTYNKARTEMFLTLNISEGSKYKIGAITCDGNFNVGDKEIKKLLKFKTDQVFNQNKIVETVHDIRDVYINKGYLYASITQDYTRDGDSDVVDINFSIKENSLVYVRNIDIDGLVSTKEKVIRREILLEPGDVFAVNKFRKSAEKIYNLGFIENLEQVILDTGALDIVDLSFSVTESKPGMITAGFGGSTVDGIIGSMQVQYLNLFGLGQRGSVRGEVGSKKQDYEIDWTDPWIFDKNASLTLGAFSSKRKRDYADVTSAYNEKRIGGSAKIGPRLSDYAGLSFGYTFENVNFSDISEKCEKVIAEKRAKQEDTPDLSQYKKTSVFGQYTYDSTDYNFDPSRGNKQLLSIQLAGTFLGGDVNFVKGIARSSWFFPTFWKFVFCINAEIGAVAAYGAKQVVRIDEKFYIGGADTVRGYKDRTQIGYENGGTFKGVMNVEYKFPIIVTKGKKTILLGAMFYDIGGSWRDFKHINFNIGSERENLHSAVGFGIRLPNPGFPMRLDLGYGLNHKTGETNPEIHFALGHVF